MDKTEQNKNKTMPVHFHLKRKFSQFCPVSTKFRQIYKRKHRHFSASKTNALCNNDKHWMKQLQHSHKGIESCVREQKSERILQFQRKNQVHSHVNNESKVSFIVVFRVKDMESKRVRDEQLFRIQLVHLFCFEDESPLMVVPNNSSKDKWPNCVALSCCWCVVDK